MEKDKGSQRKNIYLDSEVIDILENGALMNGLSVSKFISQLAYEWQHTTNPLDEINHLKTEKSKIQQELDLIERQFKYKLDKIESREGEAISRANKLQEWKEEKNKQRPKAIECISRKILENQPQEAERIAGTWSRILNIPQTQLLIESMNFIKGGKSIKNDKKITL